MLTNCCCLSDSKSPLSTSSMVVRRNANHSSFSMGGPWISSDEQSTFLSPSNGILVFFFSFDLLPNQKKKIEKRKQCFKLERRYVNMTRTHIESCGSIDKDFNCSDGHCSSPCDALLLRRTEKLSRF